MSLVSGLRTNNQVNTNNPNIPFLHLALGPGWDRSFKLDGTEDNEVCETSDRCVKFRKLHNDGWKYYSTSFSNPPPSLVPRIYVSGNRQKEVLKFVDDEISFVVDDRINCKWRG